MEPRRVSLCTWPAEAETPKRSGAIRVQPEAGRVLDHQFMELGKQCQAMAFVT